MDAIITELEFLDSIADKLSRKALILERKIAAEIAADMGEDFTLDDLNETLDEILLAA